MSLYSQVLLERVLLDEWPRRMPYKTLYSQVLLERVLWDETAR